MAPPPTLPRTLSLFLAACIACSAVPALAQEGWSHEVSASVLHRRLQERFAGGGTLLTETGPMARLQFESTRAGADGAAIALRGELAGGDLDYDGRTQAGVPLRTTTRHVEGGGSLLVRPFAPATWGELWGAAGWQRQFRGIRGTPTAGGLRETLDTAWLGLRWRSPQWQGPGAWRLRFEPEARVSLANDLEVDFHGVFDTAGFAAGRQRMLVLRITAEAQDSPWSFGLEWRQQAQKASRSAPVRLGGLLVPGTVVMQPELTVRDFGLVASRRF